MTAGHCVSSQSNLPSQYTIRIGEYNLYLPDLNTIDYQVSKIIIHTNYTGLTGKKKSTKNADIALIRTKQPIVLGDYAWPICFFDSEEEEKDGLLELRKQMPSKIVKKNLAKELNYKNNDFVEHQLTDEDDSIEENHFNILDESNCESYNQLNLQVLNSLNNVLTNTNHQTNYVDNTNQMMSIRNKTSLTDRLIDRSSFLIRSINNASSSIDYNQQLTNSIKYPISYPTSNYPMNSIVDDDTNTFNRINVTKLTKLANLVIVVGWGKKHEKADHYSTYLQKSTLCLIPNSGGRLI